VYRSTTDLIYAVSGVDWSEAGGKPKKGRKRRKRKEERGIYTGGVGLKVHALILDVSIS
jgi:hypothetical protein